MRTLIVPGGVEMCVQAVHNDPPDPGAVACTVLGAALGSTSASGGSYAGGGASEIAAGLLAGNADATFDATLDAKRTVEETAVTATPLTILPAASAAPSIETRH